MNTDKKRHRGTEGRRKTQKEMQKIQKEFLTLIARITQKEIQRIQKETYHEEHEEYKEVQEEIQIIQKDN